MTDEDYNNIGNGLIAMFGDKIPDPNNEPMRFKYYVQLYFYERFLNEQRNNEAAAKQQDHAEGNVCETPVENSESPQVPDAEVADAS
jgi:hypothetical protein